MVPLPQSRTTASSPYRGTDTKLGREVAVKILPAALAQDRRMMAADIKPGPTSQAGVPKPLFQVAFPRGNTNFAVAKDGRFLIPILQQQLNIPITVVLHWTAMLKK